MNWRGNSNIALIPSHLSLLPGPRRAKVDALDNAGQYIHYSVTDGYYSLSCSLEAAGARHFTQEESIDDGRAFWGCGTEEAKGRWVTCVRLCLKWLTRLTVKTVKGSFSPFIPFPPCSLLTALLLTFLNTVSENAVNIPGPSAPKKPKKAIGVASSKKKSRSKGKVFYPLALSHYSM